MPGRLFPVLNTILFTILVPGTVAGYIPYRLLGGVPRPSNSPLSWLAAGLVISGAAMYFRCAWEFAIRGLGTPAPIAPTKFLVTTACTGTWQPHVHRSLSGSSGRGDAVSLNQTVGVFRILLHSRATLCCVLRGTHFAPAIWGVLRTLQTLRPGLDSLTRWRWAQEKIIVRLVCSAQRTLCRRAIARFLSWKRG